MSKYNNYTRSLGDTVSAQQARDFYESIHAVSCLRNLSGKQYAYIASLMTYTANGAADKVLTDWR